MTFSNESAALRAILESIGRFDQRGLDSVLFACRIPYSYGSWSTAFTVRAGTKIVKYVDNQGNTRDTVSDGYQAVSVYNFSDVSVNYKVRTATPTDSPEVVSIKNKFRKSLIDALTRSQVESKGVRISRS